MPCRVSLIIDVILASSSLVVMLVFFIFDPSLPMLKTISGTTTKEIIARSHLREIATPASTMTVKISTVKSLMVLIRALQQIGII